jgi:hypothetical protein
MTQNTNVPAIKITPEGLLLPLEADVLKGVLDDVDTAFGGNLNRNLETPQGQLASSWTAIIADKNDKFAELVNQVNPDYNEGAMQDAIARIYFIDRKAATASVVYCDLLGLSGTVVQAGFLAKDANGLIWRLNNDVVIPESGTVQGLFTCTELGKITAPAGSISEIYQAAVGLDRINNQQDATVGQEVESRADFAFRRQNSVALNAHGTPPSVYAEVFDLESVQDVFVVDNVEDDYVTYGATNYTLKPHSIFVAVVGGDDDEIADAIWRKTGNGCNYNGNTMVTVYDTTYSSPRPEYKIYFMRPAPQPIYFNVTIEQGRNVPNDIHQIVKKAIIKDFQGGDDGERARIGSHLHATRYVSPIIVAIKGVHLMSVEIGTAIGAYGAMVELGIDQYPTIAESNIAVNIVSL